MYFTRIGGKQRGLKAAPFSVGESRNFSGGDTVDDDASVIAQGGKEERVGLSAAPRDGSDAVFMIREGAHVMILSYGRGGRARILEGDGAHTPQIHGAARTGRQNQRIAINVILDTIHPVLMTTISSNSRFDVTRVPETDAAVITSSNEVVRIIRININVANANFMSIRNIEDFSTHFECSLR